MFRGRHYSLFLSLALAITFLFTVHLLARSAEPAAPTSTITVNSAADVVSDDENCTLREAIQAANTDTAVDACPAGGGADTIAFDLPANSTITLSGSQLPAINDTLTISGTQALNLTISGDGQSRVFEIGSSAAVTMTHLTIADGFLTSNSVGGGIYNNGVLVLLHSTLSGNSAQYGGGIYNDVNGAVTVSNSTFSDNEAELDSGSGGGIYNELNGTVTMSNSTFSGNLAGGGGGILNNGTVTMSNSTLSANLATEGGGGIYNYEGTVTLSNSTLNGNSASIFAGGIYNNGGTVTMSNSTLSGNSAYYGGGIYNDSAGTVTMNNSMLSANSAEDDGGGIYNTNSGIVTMSNSTLSENSAGGGGGIANVSSNGTITMSNSTLSGNSATIFGGGGIQNSGNITMNNSTLSENSARSGGGIYNNGDLTMSNSTLSGNSADFGGGGIVNIKNGDLTMNNSIIANSASGGDCTNFGTLASNINNLIESGNCGDADTITDDPLLGPLQDNGGDTFTHTLLPGSPAIDAGDNSTCQKEDQRGATRPFDGDGDGIATCDIGAVESQGFTPPFANAGPDQQVLAGEIVHLDGSGSYDSDAFDVISYDWQQTGGATVTLSDSAVVSPTFDAPQAPELLTFTLTVTDSSGLSSTDEVEVEVVEEIYAVYLPLLQR